MDSFTCPECGRTSYHPTDIAEGYCGACHRGNLERRLERGAEPYWMQDVRVAQRAIEAARRAIARSRPDESGDSFRG